MISFGTAASGFGPDLCPRHGAAPPFGTGQSAASEVARRGRAPASRLRTRPREGVHTQAQRSGPVPDQPQHSLARELDLVFTSAVGRPTEPGNFLRRSFWPLLARAGLPHMRGSTTSAIPL
jgi:hypothetical protein